MDYDLNDWKMVLATCVLIACMLWDISVGNTKKRWIPSNLLVLSALTIQILGYIDTQKVNIFGPFNEEGLDMLVVDQLEMDAAKLTMCVFIGCVLPGMAMAGTEGRWNYVVALVVSLSISIATEIYALQNVSRSKVSNEAGPWFVSSGVLLSVGASFLILLLGVAIFCGKLIRSLVACRNVMIFSKEYKANNEDQWERFRSEVNKSWIGARSWKTWYFICNSAFSPGAAMIVTACVAAMIGKVVCRSSLVRLNNGGSNLKFYLQCIFIFVGWILMLCRGFNAALRCPTSILFGVISKIGSVFRLPPAVLVNLVSHRLAYFLLNLKIRSTHFLLLVTFLVPLFPVNVLILGICLVLLFCYICCYFSTPISRSQCLKRLFKLDENEPSGSSEYINSEIFGALKTVQKVFWEMNAKAFEKRKTNWDENVKIGGGREVWHSIIRNHRVHQQQRLQSKEKWVKTVSSICKDIADLDIVVDMKDALALYRETRDVLNFVDWPENIFVDPSNIFVALNFYAFEDSINWEGEMQKLEKKSNRASGTSPGEEDVPAKAKVIGMLKKWMGKFESPEHNSNNLFSGLENKSLQELGKVPSALVCQIIVSHLLEAPDLILKHTKHWAQTFHEKKIDKAIELAGKVRALLQPVDDDMNIIRSFPPSKSDNLPVAP